MMKKIGVGYENFKKLIDDGCYFVDKSLLIRDVVEKGGAVTLFTRPRRFGKTLAMSMLQTFFEKEIDRADRYIGYMGEMLNTLYFMSRRNRLRIAYAGCRFLGYSSDASLTHNPND